MEDNMAEVKVYTVDYCPYCKKAKALLDKKGVEYEEIDITNHPEMREKLVEMSGGRDTVPEVFIDGVCVGGSTDLDALNSSGKLDEMLNK